MTRVNHKDMLLAIVWDVNISFWECKYLVSWLMDQISDISAVFTSPKRSLEAFSSYYYKLAVVDRFSCIIIIIIIIIIITFVIEKMLNISSDC